jgi:hypothetical protein
MMEAIAVLSSGALVPHREFGNPTFLDISGCEHGDSVPLLDAHRHADLLGRVRDIWVEGGQLKATLRFANTAAGCAAFSQLPNGVSIGTSSDSNDVAVVDAMGRERDFDEREWRLYHQDPSAILHAKRWRLLEVSMTTRPADRGAIARPSNRVAQRIRRRMEERQRRADDDSGLLLRSIMPRRGTILFGAPESLHLDGRLAYYAGAGGG